VSHVRSQTTSPDCTRLHTTHCSTTILTSSFVYLFNFNFFSFLFLRAPTEEAVDEYFVILDDVLNTSTLSEHSRGALEKYRMKNNISREVHLDCLQRLQWSVSDFEAGFKPIPNSHTHKYTHTQDKGASTSTQPTHTDTYSRTFSPYPAASYENGPNTVLSQLTDIEK
jgi:hypothetical protein